MEVQPDFKELLALYIGREQLVANKRATGRLRDLADLEALGDK
jgi:hypothetical protein